MLPPKTRFRLAVSAAKLAAAAVALPPPRCHRHAATATLPPPPCSCLHRRQAADAANTALLPSCHRCR